MSDECHLRQSNYEPGVKKSKQIVAPLRTYSYPRAFDRCGCHASSVYSYDSHKKQSPHSVNPRLGASSSLSDRYQPSRTVTDGGCLDPIGEGGVVSNTSEFSTADTHYVAVPCIISGPFRGFIALCIFFDSKRVGQETVVATSADRRPCRMATSFWCVPCVTSAVPWSTAKYMIFHSVLQKKKKKNQLHDTP
ncbi:hypothetical protein K474DRAFT_1178314 [Panus rudis PR-1116 ss-1]|nr:hypothetical protein K474DRAFT_1178314 [Panus rudis PR-1116 ss-1]